MRPPHFTSAIQTEGTRATMCTRRQTSVAFCVVTLIFLIASQLHAQSVDAPSDDDPSASLIVKLEASGPSAVDTCAEAEWRAMQLNPPESGGRLGAFHQRFSTVRVTPLFRTALSDHEGLESRQQQLADQGVRVMAAAALREPNSSVASVAGAESPLAHRWSELAGIYRLTLPAGTDLQAARAALIDTPGVAYVQLDQAHSLDQAVPLNDPYLSSSGAWGQDFADLWGLDRVRAPEAWQDSQGAGITIAIVDTGVDAAHPDLAANMWINPGEDLNGNGVIDPPERNGIDDDANGFVDDFSGWNFVGFGDVGEDGIAAPGSPDFFDDVGHGTHVAGIAAAVGNNGIGIAGVAHSARIMGLKAFPAMGSARDADLWRAVLYAVEQGARVINGSWSCFPSCPDNPLASEVLALAEAAGAVFVTSAGNATRDVVINAPENSSAAITVGSIGFDDQISSFSNVGWLIDVVAPGGDPATPRGIRVARRNILSTRSSGTRDVEAPFFVDDAYYRFSGTSMAAPAVAGAAALLLSDRPELTGKEVRRLLRITSRDLGAPGHDPVYGGGAIDLVSLLATESPALSLDLIDPGVGAVVDAGEGEVAILGRAGGADVESVSLAYARGLEAGPFLSIDDDVIFSSDEGGPIELLSSWDASAVEDGPVTLRLRATLANGEHVDEYQVIALERNAFDRLSDGEENEEAPSISRGYAVWRAQTSDGDALMLGGYDHRGVRVDPAVVHQSDRTIKTPRISKGRIVWLEASAVTGEERLMTCFLGTGRWRAEPCRAREIADSESRMTPISLGTSRVIWSERVGSVLRLLTCRLRGSLPCQEQGLPDGLENENSLRLFDFDGQTAVWSRSGSASGVEVCRFEGAAETCRLVEVPVSPLLSPVNEAAVDGDRLVIESFRIGGSLLFQCALDFSSGDCDLQPVGEDETGSVTPGANPQISGRRIAWEQTRPGEPTSLAFCEIDPLDARCPVQRLTGGVVPSGEPDIDGHRIIWQDERFGPWQVLSLPLPQLYAEERVRVRAGQRRPSFVYARGSAGEPLTLELEAGEGPTPAEFGAAAFGAAGGWGWVMIEPPIEARGTARWRLVGEGEGGLKTTVLMEVTVDPPEDAALE